METVDVVIPHLNYEHWDRTIKTLLNNTPEGVIRKIFVIEQNPISYRLWPKDSKVVMVHTKNLGFARAMNTGLRLSDAPYVMCLNDDVTFLHKDWWKGIIETFEAVPNALCVNPASVCDPDGSGGKTILEGFELKEEYSDEEYARLREVKGSGWIDGICMWGPVFKREMLDKLPGIVPGKAWFDERFFPGGGEDYDMNRRAYLSGMRCLGTSNSVVWHVWHGTHNGDGKLGAHHDGGTFDEKWITPEGEKPDIMGNRGRKDIPLNLIREDL